MTVETDFPQVLDTARLELRCYSNIDAPKLQALVERNRDQLIQNFSSMVQNIVKESKATSFVNKAVEQWRSKSTFHYGIWHKPSKELIGQLKLKNVNWEVPAAELSYFIAGTSQRKGFATEAISAVLRVAFEKMNFRRVFLRIIPTNGGSLQLAEKLHFKHEGLHRNAFRCGFGELHDVHYYSLTDEDFF
jgi:ribosomal-protein-serine acetyltransferase